MTLSSSLSARAVCFRDSPHHPPSLHPLCINQQALVAKLLSKLDLYISEKDKKHHKFKEAVAADIEEKLQVPGGASLLATIGYVYKQEAIKFSGGFLGIVGYSKEPER